MNDFFSDKYKENKCLKRRRSEIANKLMISEISITVSKESYKIKQLKTIYYLCYLWKLSHHSFDKSPGIKYNMLFLSSLKTTNITY